MLLRTCGHDVEMVSNGQQALERAAATTPDVILADIGLPVMDGYALAERIRGHDVLRDTLLVAMTGYGQPEDIERSKKSGYDHHLVKPVEWAKLLQILSDLKEKH